MKWDKVEVKTEQVVDEEPGTWILSAIEDLEAENFDSALEKLQQARAFAKNDPAILADTYDLETSTYWHRGNKPAAREASRLLREYGNLARAQRGAPRFETDPRLAHVCMEVNPNDDFWYQNWLKSVDNVIAKQDFEIIEKLLDYEEVYSFTEKTLAEHATNDFVFAVVQHSKLNLLQALHRGGFNLSACKSLGGRNLLMTAATDNSSADILNFLLNNKINDVNEKDDYGSTALMRWANSAQYTSKNFELLINAGANVNATKNKSQTALMLAAKRNDTEKIRLLIDSGANVSLRDDNDCDAIYYTEDAECLRLLAGHGADVNQHYSYFSGKTLLHRVAEDNHWQRSSYWEALLSLGADVNAKDNLGSTPLEYALDHSWTFTAELDLPRALVRKGATVTYEAKQIMRRRKIKESNLYNNSPNFFFSSWFESLNKTLNNPTIIYGKKR